MLQRGGRRSSPEGKKRDKSRPIAVKLAPRAGRRIQAKLMKRRGEVLQSSAENRIRRTVEESSGDGEGGDVREACPSIAEGEGDARVGVSEPERGELSHGGEGLCERQDGDRIVADVRIVGGESESCESGKRSRFEVVLPGFAGIRLGVDEGEAGKVREREWQGEAVAAKLEIAEMQLGESWARGQRLRAFNPNETKLLYASKSR